METFKFLIGFSLQLTYFLSAIKKCSVYSIKTYIVEKAIICLSDETNRNKNLHESLDNPSADGVVLAHTIYDT